MPATEQRPGLGQFPVTSGLLALIVALFFVEELRGGSTDTLVLLQMGANYPPLVLEGQWYRLVTSTLLHIGVLHLLFNGWALWQLGRLSEMSFGGATTLFLFVFTGIGGSALTLLTTKVSAGASGALFGLEGALVAFFLRHRERLTPVGKQLLKQLLVWSGLMLVYTFAAPGIDWLGHLGGLFAGLAVGWLLRPWRGGAPGPLARAAAGLAALTIVAALAFLLAGERFVPRSAGGVAVEAPASWRAESAEGGLAVRDPLATFGTGAFVSVDLAAGSDPARALALSLEDEGGLPAGLELGAEVRQQGAWLRRTFVWRLDGGELAGFAQARCEAGACLVVLAASRGEVYGDYFAVLERIAGTARRAG